MNVDSKNGMFISYFMMSITFRSSKHMVRYVRFHNLFVTYIMTLEVKKTLYEFIIPSTNPFTNYTKINQVITPFIFD